MSFVSWVFVESEVAAMLNAMPEPARTRGIILRTLLSAYDFHFEETAPAKATRVVLPGYGAGMHVEAANELADIAKSDVVTNHSGPVLRSWECVETPAGSLFLTTIDHEVVVHFGVDD